MERRSSSPRGVTCDADEGRNASEGRNNPRHADSVIYDVVFFGYDATDPRSRNRQRCLLSRLLFLRLSHVVGVGGASFSSSREPPRSLRRPRHRRRRRQRQLAGDCRRGRCRRSRSLSSFRFRIHACTCARSFDVPRPRRQHSSRLLPRLFTNGK